MTDQTKRVRQDEIGPSGTKRANRESGDPVVSTGPSGTSRVDRETLAPPTAHSVTPPKPLGWLDPGTVICGECLVEETKQPHETMRPGLYRCRLQDTQVMVKVAAMQYPPKEDLWAILPSLCHPNVIRTLRVMQEGSLYFEVQEYCQGGNLRQYVPLAGRHQISEQQIRDWLLPQVSKGLAYLHQQGIVHRDVKPENLYIRKSATGAKVVLGDFDISTTLDTTHTSRMTERIGATWWYAAPETFPGLVRDGGGRMRVTFASDYYSLGITLIELLLGTTSLHGLREDELFDEYLSGTRVAIPEAISTTFRELLEGLLCRSREYRWGGEEIARWLNGTTTEADRKRIIDDRGYSFDTARAPYKLGRQVAIDLRSLATAMSLEPTLAMQDLMEGDTLLHWISGIDSNVAREIRRDRETHRKMPDVVLICAIMRCNPSSPFRFPDGAVACNSSEWIRCAIRYVTEAKLSPEKYFNEVAQVTLVTWLQLKTPSEPELVKQISAICKSPTHVQFEELAYLLQPERPYAIGSGLNAASPMEIAQLTYGAANDWKNGRPASYDASYQRWRHGALYAWMRQRGLADLVGRCEVIAQKMPDEPVAAFETILRLLDNTLPPVHLVFETTALSSERSLAYKAEETLAVTYTTVGCGVPFGTFLPCPPIRCIRIENALINQRKGKITFIIDAGDVTVGRTYTGCYKFTGEYTKTKTPTLQLRFHAYYPLSITVLRIVFGALLGMLIFGIPRLIISLLGNQQHIKIEIYNIALLWNDVTNERIPLIPEVISLVVLFVFVLVALRLLVFAFRHSEV